MGTRYLTVVIDEDGNRISQYGHYDGDPSSNGVEILYTLLADKNKTLKERMKRCEIITEDEYSRFVENHSLDDEALEKAHPNFWWGDGVDLLRVLLETERKPLLRDYYEFAYKSLLCEWGYVIDYCSNTFEVYKGFVKEPLDTTERFYNNGYKDGGFYPIRLKMRYDLDLLPSPEQFIKDCVANERS